MYIPYLMRLLGLPIFTVPDHESFMRRPSQSDTGSSRMLLVLRSQLSTSDIRNAIKVPIPEVREGTLLVPEHKENT